MNERWSPTWIGVGIANVFAGERRDDVRRMLVEHRRELLGEIQNRVRDVREDGSGKHHHSTDPAEAFEVESDDDLALVVIQMKTEVLDRINDAVRHFDEGIYGYCVDCREIITTSRLRAMPFAVRCRDCEEARECEQYRGRVPLLRASSGLGSRY